MTMYDPYTDRFIVENGASMLPSRGNPASASCVECGLLRKNYKPMTNADRIRQMTDEELADFLDRWEMGDVDYSKTFCNLCDGQYDCHDDCLMDWLKSPVEVQE